MGQPVNFENFRELTGGDVSLEAELFRIFLTSSNECVAEMQKAMNTEDKTAWKKYAHALKGMCYNLGAEALGELCKKAQDDYLAIADEKRLMLNAIKSEFARVKDMLQKAA